MRRKVRRGLGRAGSWSALIVTRTNFLGRKMGPIRVGRGTITCGSTPYSVILSTSAGAVSLLHKKIGPLINNPTR